MTMKAAARYLEIKGLGRLGSTIFVNDMPASCMEGVLLRDGYSGTPIDPYTPKWRQPVYHLTVRSADYARGENLAWKVIEEMTFDGEMDVEGLQFRQMRPLAEPRSYRRGAGGFWEFEIEVAAVLVAAR